MKTTLLNILALAALLVSFASCNNDEDKLYAKPGSEVNAPVLSYDGFTEIVVDEANIDLTPFILSWSSSDFGESVLVEYSLELATKADFSDAYNVTIGNNLYSRAVSNSELSNWTISHFNGLDESENPVKTDLNLRIAATVALENPSVTIPPDVVYSNAIQVQVTPFFVPAAFPEELFMIGKDFGDWNWESDGVVVMNPVHSNPGHFWCIRYITAGNGFKWAPNREWKNDFNSQGEDIGFTVDGGDALVAEDGLYMVYVDMENKKISVETAKVFGMGDCFGGWEVGEYPFTIDGKTLKRTTTADGELRMYANSDIAPIGSDWWKMEFVIFDGVITYRGAGDDQDRVTVTAGKEVTLEFNTESATIK